MGREASQGGQEGSQRKHTQIQGLAGAGSCSVDVGLESELATPLSHSRVTHFRPPHVPGQLYMGTLPARILPFGGSTDQRNRRLGYT